MAKAGTLGEFPSDAAKDHQGPGGPYSGQTQEWPIDMPPGTTECPRCSRPGDLPKQRVGESTLGAHLVWAGPPPVLVGVGTEGGAQPRSAVSGQEEEEESTGETTFVSVSSSISVSKEKNAVTQLPPLSNAANAVAQQRQNLVVTSPLLP